MKTKLLYFGALLALVACKKELEPQESTATTDSAAVVAPADPAAQLEQMVQQQQQQSAPQPAQTAPGTNPPHGQPGHRCDIAVGAPLSSAPAPAGNSSNNMVLSNPPANAGKAAIVPSPAASSTPAATAPGMNPPHGQPGHRCDIPVGQPLSSAGAAKATEVPAILAPAE